MEETVTTPISINERKVAEEALRLCEQRFQALLTSSALYVYVVTMDRSRGVRTSHSPGCEGVTGFTPSEFDVDPSLWYRMIHEEDRPPVLAQIARIVEGEAPRPLEHRIIHKDGEVRWIRNVPIPQRDPKGRVVAYVGLISDITERKRAEQLLAVQYAVTSQLAEAGPLPEALHMILKALCATLPWDWAGFWTFNAKTKALEWSGIRHSPSIHLQEFEQANQTLKFASGVGLLGRPLASGHPVWIADAVQERDFLRAAVAARVGLHGACLLPVRRGEETMGMVELFSHKVQPPDLHLLQMLTEAGAKIAQFLGRKWAEEALTTERNLLRTLIDALPDYIYAKDTASRFVVNNLAHVRVLGAAQPQDAVARTDLDFFPRKLALRYRADDEAVLQSGRPLFNQEELVVDREGNQQWVLTTKVPWKDSQGRIVGLIGVSRDVTERKRWDENQRLSDDRLKATLQELKATNEKLKATELQLIQAAKLECIGALAAGVAHEVKNPLQTMLMGLRYLAHNLPPNTEGIAVVLHDMRDAVTRANAIVRGLLELSADSKTDRQAEDLNACVERSLDLLRYELVATQTTVVRQLAVDMPPVLMDRGKMEQVFINLFLNALHAMSNGGILTVTTRAAQWSEDLASQESSFRRFKSGDCLAITEVQDTGTGIPESLLPRVFDPFFTTKPVGHGTGLGLAVVKKIVDLHGGAIAIRNEPPRGVRVTILLKLETEITP
jgi:PAS domain S-box-containing protein